LKAKGEKCTQVQAGQTIASYSFSGISGSSSNWCWTFIPVAGHVKTKWATVNLWGAVTSDLDLAQVPSDRERPRRAASWPRAAYPG
jgi:hypothetical protein